MEAVAEEARRAGGGGGRLCARYRTVRAREEVIGEGRRRYVHVCGGEVCGE